MTKNKKVPHSTATYVEPDGYRVCELEELANTYKYMKNVPERLGWVKASEVALLARGYLSLLKMVNKDIK